MADTKLQLLLRQYRQSGEPALAVAIANHLTRTVVDPSQDLKGVEIWVVDTFDGSDSGSTITLFADEDEAYAYAAKEALEVWVASGAARQMRQTLEGAQERYAQGQYEGALSYYNSGVEDLIGFYVYVYSSDVL